MFFYIGNCQTCVVFSIGLCQDKKEDKKNQGRWKIESKMLYHIHHVFQKKPAKKGLVGMQPECLSRQRNSRWGLPVVS